METNEQRDFEFPGDFVGPVIETQRTQPSRHPVAKCGHGVPTSIVCVYCGSHR